MLQLLLTVVLTLSIVLPAQADSLIDGLQDHKSVSDFYQLLSKTDALDALKDEADFMVFAPSNEHFTAISNDHEKCLRRKACKKVLSKILRNHITNKQQSLRDAARYKKGLFSINNHFIPLSKRRGRYPDIEGNKVLHSQTFDNGVIYIIDGILAGNYEMSLLDAHKQAAEPIIEKTTKTTKTTIPDPACGPAGCPDKATTVTTIKRTITEVIE